MVLKATFISRLLEYLQWAFSAAPRKSLHFEFGHSALFRLRLEAQFILCIKFMQIGRQTIGAIKRFVTWAHLGAHRLTGRDDVPVLRYTS